MKSAPYLPFLVMTVSSLCHGTTIDVYSNADMAQALGIGMSYELILHEDISYPQPENKSTLYYSSDYVFRSSDETNPADLSFYGTGDERGEVLHNCAATFHNLGDISFANWINTWADYGGDDKNSYASAYGGVLSGDDGDSIIFRGNGAVSFSSIVYDSSDWGANSCEIKVHGGAIHTAGAGQVEFADNSSVTLQQIRSINVHDTNYSYKDFYAFGGAISTASLQISNTAGSVTLSDNEIYQGICTDVVGEGKGAAVYVTNTLTISGSVGTISLDRNNILVANRAQGGALYLANDSKGAISDNLLHVQLMDNKVKVAPDMAYGLVEDSLAATSEACGGAIYVDGELLIERNRGNITMESNSATADYSLVAEQSHGDDHINDPAYALGGAVYLAEGATLSICYNGTEGVTDTGDVSFIKNEVSTTGTNNGVARGGAIFVANHAALHIANNSGTVTFSGNKAEEGAAFFLSSGSSATLNNNTGKVEFAGNSASENGGAVDAQGTLSIENNSGGVKFSGNSAACGGAIYAENRVSVNNNAGGVEFSGNSASGHGGAIYAAGNAAIDISYNQAEVLFANNDSDTGAIHLAEGASLTITNNAAVSFNGQGSTTLYGEGGSTAHISQNDSFTIAGHEIYDSSAVHTAGALYIEENHGNISFSDNAVLKAAHGAVFTLSGNNAQLSICGNKGSIVATGNYAAGSGAVIYADSAATIQISDNADVLFTENDSRKGAAAIDTQGNLLICNNTGSVIFGNNRVYDDETGASTLCSISVAGQASFTAAAGHRIEFRDSISVGSSDLTQPILILNKDYTGDDSPGDVVFTGQYIDTYAADILINTEPSRYSSVQGDTLLHAGRLVISHQATLAGTSLTTSAGNGATIVLHEGGTLAQQNVTISSGSTLQAGETPAVAQASAETSAVLTLEDVVISTPVCGYFDGTALAMESGSAYTMNGGILDLDGGTLTFNVADSPSGVISLTSLQSPVLLGDQYVLLLFSGVSNLTLNGDFMFSLAGQVYGTEQLVFDAEQQVVYLHGLSIPEPATTTLSLLALCGLVARRRRCAR